MTAKKPDLSNMKLKKSVGVKEKQDVKPEKPIVKQNRKPDLSSISARRKTELNKEVEALIQSGEVAEVNLDEVYRDELQPRPLEEVMEGLQEFADQLERDKFQLAQLPVYSITEKGYQIVVGERRTEAFRLKHQEKITAVIKRFSESDKEKMILMQYIENDGDLKKPLSAIADARWWRRYIDTFHGGNISSAATARGKSVADVSNRLQILDAPEYITEFTKTAKIRDAATIAALVRLDKRAGEDTVKSIVDDYSAGLIKMSLRNYVESMSKAVRQEDPETITQIANNPIDKKNAPEKKENKIKKETPDKKQKTNDENSFELRLMETNKKLKAVAFKVRIAETESDGRKKLLGEVDSIMKELAAVRDEMLAKWEIAGNA